MARPSKTNHPLQQLRARVGKMTRPGLGDILKVSTQTIKKIEKSEQELTEIQQVRLLNRFGVMPQSLLSTSQKPMDVFGRPFTEASYHNWTVKQGYDEITDEMTDRILKGSFKYITALFRAAARKRAFMAAKFGLNAWIRAMIRELELGFEFPDQLSAYPNNPAAR